MKLDSREFSKEAYEALNLIANKLDKKYHERASNLVQGLTGY